MQRTAWIIAACILTGCASAGRIGTLPVVTDSTASSTLVLIRATNIVGMANSNYVALDGIDVFSIRSGDNTHFAIPAGQHTIAVKCFGGWTPTWKEDSKEFIAERNRPSYFAISPSMSCAQIERVSEAEGKALLTNTTFVDPATPSNRDTQTQTSSNECPLQWRHGVREPVCASQALAPPPAATAASAAPATDDGSIPQSAAIPAPMQSVVPAVPAPSAHAASAPRTRLVAKVVGGKTITCRVPIPDLASRDWQSRQTATVIVRVAMSPPSVVNQVTLAESSGDTSLDSAAMRAAVGLSCDGLEQPTVFLQPYEFDPQGNLANARGSSAGASN